MAEINIVAPAASLKASVCAQKRNVTHPNNDGSFVHQSGTLQKFTVDSVFTEGVQHFKWYLNGTLVSEGSANSYTINENQSGSFILKVVITDDTGLIVKDDKLLSIQTVEWFVKTL